MAALALALPFCAQTIAGLPLGLGASPLLFFFLAGMEMIEGGAEIEIHSVHMEQSWKQNRGNLEI
jgi:hypothetical protein